MGIGDNIKKFRLEKGYTQKQLGILSETSENTVRQYELGKREPRIEQLQKIANILGVATSKLIGDDPEDTTAHDFQETCDWLELAGFAVEPLGEYGNYRIMDASEKEVGSMNEYDLINLCQQIVEQGQELKDSFIVEKLKLLFSK